MAPQFINQRNQKGTPRGSFLVLISIRGHSCLSAAGAIIRGHRSIVLRRVYSVALGSKDQHIRFEGKYCTWPGTF
ncbi:MAG: hypothetical protein UW08_C0017G0007 [Parcubacteria group bacterium GW2011_GWB1_43_8b]|nr:MAG: hypothetical protein UW08_C0017G0007 [Parcubacteria group bacterium GW2011_GWB1_43_8b]KKT85640.1 MAG: hypothetical protein UW85_C0016G0005 [Parcubacteria group bacterium GW2011_GWA1_Parcubacteria_45_10]